MADRSGPGPALEQSPRRNVRKIRPVLVISSAGYNRRRQDLIVAAMIVTGILRTIKQMMVERRLGRMADTEMQAFGRLLRRALAL